MMKHNNHKQIHYDTNTPQQMKLSYITVGGLAVLGEAWKETFGTSVIQKHFCQFNPSYWQKRCFVTKLFQFLPLLNYKMSWDSLMPYVTAWMCTRVFKSVKDSTV